VQHKGEAKVEQEVREEKEDKGAQEEKGAKGAKEEKKMLVIGVDIREA
jgi:hypothetical protein